MTSELSTNLKIPPIAGVRPRKPRVTPPLLTGLLGGLLLLHASMAGADITLRSGYTTLELSSQRFWSISSMDHRARPVMEVNSGNGVVILFGDGTYSGEGHGGELYESVVFSVDGMPTTITDGETYRGTTLSVVRSYTLDESVRVRHVLVLSPEGIDQIFTLESLGVSRAVTFAYVPAETRANRLTEIEVRNGDTIVEVASTYRDDRRFFRSSSGAATNTIIQRDPNLVDAVITRWTGFPSLGVTPWVWDRSFDNKLYLVANAYDNTALSITALHSVRFCEGTACSR